jgi:Tfp pilus assembly protein PilO
MEKMRQWATLTGVGVVAVLVAGWFLLVSPQRSHIASLHTQTASQQQSNAALQTRVNQLEQQKRNQPAEQAKLDKINTQVPSDPQLPTLIRQLSAAAQGAGVDLVSMQPSQPQAVAAAAPAASSVTAAGAAAPAASPLDAIPVSITITGSYYNLENFFHHVEGLTRAMLVTQFSITPASGTSGSTSGSGKSTPGQLAPGTLQAQLSAQVYESPAVTAAPGSTTASAQ